MPNRIAAKNNAFALAARENAGKPRIRAKDIPAEEAENETLESKKQRQVKGRNIVKPARKDKLSSSSTSGAGLRNNKLALGLIVFVVIGGVFFELMRMFL
ncbi:uncharacterized protein MEPE_03300 [Melanopsichium pennsylvanicum]|uniref:Stress-associated endoplasmic reticulum protein n=1 Tax=Melanopsichium pennsylvanicum TaxID=63383 RepID=A0AAJ4XME4_9BASI|nr:uncharacterized protein MEPE_03300 [Melanopsichium pennsylvanicum]